MNPDQEAALANWRIYCADLEQIGASLIEHDKPQSPSKTLLNTVAARIALDSPTTTRDNLPERSVLVRCHLADAIMRACSELDPSPTRPAPPCSECAALRAQLAAALAALEAARPILKARLIDADLRGHDDTHTSAALDLIAQALDHPAR